MQDHVLSSPSVPGWYHSGSSKLWRYWTLEHLKGERPQGHPAVIRRNSEGQALFEAGQVWVDDKRVLTQITKVEMLGSFVLYVNFYRYPIKSARRVTEAEFRRQYVIWDDAVKQA